MGKNICGIESRASSALPELTDEIKANRTSLDESRYISYDSYINDPERENYICLLYTSPSPRDGLLSRMPSSA